MSRSISRGKRRTVGDPLFQGVQSELAVMEQALDTAALMLGTGKSRGDRLEMIAADFLAGASLEPGARGYVVPGARAADRNSSVAQRLQLSMGRASVEPVQTKRPRLRLKPKRTASSPAKCSCAMDGAARIAGRRDIFRSTTSAHVAGWR